MGISIMAGILLLPEPIDQHPISLMLLIAYAVVILACAIVIKVKLRRMKLRESTEKSNFPN